MKLNLRNLVKLATIVKLAARTSPNPGSDQNIKDNKVEVVF